MSENWFVLPINPDPWAIGPLSIGKKAGKFFPIVGRNQQLHAFKEAVRDELGMQGFSPDLLVKDEGVTHKVTFYFWRRLESNTAGTKKNTADATNLQKATEDALQGILFENDRTIRDVRSVIVEQSDTVNPCIAIKFEQYVGFDPNEIPDEVWNKIDDIETPALFDNSWGGPNG